MKLTGRQTRRKDHLDTNLRKVSERSYQRKVPDAPWFRKPGKKMF